MALAGTDSSTPTPRQISRKISRLSIRRERKHTTVSISCPTELYQCVYSERGRDVPFNIRNSNGRPKKKEPPVDVTLRPGLFLDAFRFYGSTQARRRINARRKTAPSPPVVLPSPLAAPLKPTPPRVPRPQSKPYATRLLKGRPFALPSNRALGPNLKRRSIILPLLKCVPTFNYVFKL
ncbi:hypothetical protein EVAR_6093_1 [Eumeta japonica]|uniref:Uncharacterized protein n=1 Tax=Eumeta variegata TaxID=151549 RepID=A0A4C1TGR4_EUMVA|nr:hypothetical protein EVAR_6093_1 [Eumeta japonica]